MSATCSLCGAETRELWPVVMNPHVKPHDEAMHDAMMSIATGSAHYGLDIRDGCALCADAAPLSYADVVICGKRLPRYGPGY